MFWMLIILTIPEIVISPVVESGNKSTKKINMKIDFNFYRFYNMYTKYLLK